MNDPIYHPLLVFLRNKLFIANAHSNTFTVIHSSVRVMVKIAFSGAGAVIVVGVVW